jgi:hypothetical protein
MDAAAHAERIATSIDKYRENAARLRGGLRPL